MKQNSLTTIKDLKSIRQLNYIQSIWQAIMSMNTHKLAQLLDDNIDYEDIGKEKFIDKLHNRFQNHKTWGDSELLLDLDYCKGCNCDLPICKFVGNVSGKHFGLFFEIERNFIKDIYHCNWYGEDFDFSVSP